MFWWKKKGLFVKARNSCIFLNEILVVYKTHLFVFLYKQSLRTVLILMQICRKTTNSSLGIIIWIVTLKYFSASIVLELQLKLEQKIAFRSLTAALCSSHWCVLESSNNFLQTK